MSESDPLSSILSTRRIPHGKSSRSAGGGRGSRGKSKGNAAAVFDPRKVVGEYVVRLGSGSSSSMRSESSRRDDSRLVIHGFTEGEEGLFGSFDFGVSGVSAGGHGGGGGRVMGMVVLAGSRVGLRGIVEGLEDDDDDEDEDEESGEEEEQAEEEEEEDQDEEEKQDDFNSTHATDGDEGEESEDEVVPQLSKLELEDARINRRAKAFEKNSFRNPKFWMRWRGYISRVGSESTIDTAAAAAAATATAKATDGSESSEDDNNDDHNHHSETESRKDDVTGVDEVNMGYVVFSGNDCSGFDGTISCGKLGWNNLKLKGFKVKSRVGGRCPYEWNEFR